MPQYTPRGKKCYANHQNCRVLASFPIPCPSCGKKVVCYKCTTNPIGVFLDPRGDVARIVLEGQNVFAPMLPILIESLFRGELRRFAPLAVAESCTGGMAAAALTALPGASKWFGFGVVSYSDAAKMEILKVPKSILQKYGAVSSDTAIAMCEGLRDLGAGAGLSITGIAGPDGGSKEKPVGTVWLGCFLGNNHSRAIIEHFSGDRDAIREHAVNRAFLELLRLAQDIINGEEQKQIDIEKGKHDCSTIDIKDCSPKAQPRRTADAPRLL